MKSLVWAIIFILMVYIGLIAALGAEEVVMDMLGRAL